MAGEWTGGVVASVRDGDPPSVEEWVDVDVPGRPAEFVGVDGPIAYRTRFDDPRSRDAQRLLLVLSGVYGRARVWLNGEPVGEHAVPFVPGRFELEPAATNELIVVCHPPESCGGIHATDEVPEALAVPRIRWDVDVQILPPTFLRRLSVAPRLTDDGAVIDATVEVDAAEAIDEAVTLSLRPEGFRGGGSMERLRVETAGAGRITERKALRVRDPSLWWPRGHGPQHRYAVRAKLGDHALERTTGLRRVERDDDGFVVNGERVRARGFTRLPGGDERADVDRAVDANATFLRARAHVPPHAFHDACDEAGVLVWQDLPVTGPSVDVDRATTLANALVEAYGHHPSLGLYGVQDEPSDPFADPLGSGRLDRLRFRWRCFRAGVDRADAEAVAATFPDDASVVPVTGAPGTGADAAHLFPGWRYLAADDVEWVLDRYPALGTLVGGFGAGSLADDVPADEVPGLDPAPLERHAPDPEASRTYQATVVKTVAEALRRRECGAFAAATLRDPAAGGGMGVLASDGSEKPAYRAIAAAYEPVQAVLDGPPEPGSIGVTLVNDTPEAVEATVTWRAGEGSGELRATADSFGTAPAGAVEVPDGADGIDLEVTAGERTARNRYHL